MFNLIATTYRGTETQALAELQDLLAQLGDDSPNVRTTYVAGLITAQTSLNPFTVTEQLRRIFDGEPWRIKYLMRVIPIEAVTETGVEKIVEEVLKLLWKIGENDTFRVTVEKRRFNISSMDIIKAVAEKVDRKVSLENPDWVVLVEIIGRTTGVSVLRPSQIFSVTGKPL